MRRCLQIGEQKLGRTRVMMLQWSLRTCGTDRGGRATYSSDFMQLALEGEAEVIEVKIVEIVVERILTGSQSA